MNVTRGAIVVGGSPMGTRMLWDEHWTRTRCDVVFEVADWFLREMMRDLKMTNHDETFLHLARMRPRR